MGVSLFKGRAKQTFAAAWPQLLFVTIVIGMLSVRAMAPLRVVYPILALVIALRLQQVSVAAYVSFVFWLWFLSPLVRRIADYYGGWQDQSLILLTPYLVSALVLTRVIDWALHPHAPRPRVAGMSVLLLAAAGVALGVPFGVFKSVNAAMVEMLNYFLPLLFGWYVATSGDHAQDIGRALSATFSRAAVVIGGYGVYQFTAAPPWDANWIINTEMTTVGAPEPFGIRVFSTMHSPGVLGFFLVFGLALWIARPVASGLPGAALSAATLVLSLVRSAWLAFAATTILVVASLKPKQQVKAIVFATAMTLVTGAFVLTPEMSQIFGNRFSTMQRLDDDESAVSRWQGHVAMLDFIVREPLGLGVGQLDPTIETYLSMRDSVFVGILVQSGLVGGILYLMGLAGLTLQLWRYYRHALTPEGRAFACVGLGMLPASFLGVINAGPVGFCLWTIGGLALADRHLARRRLAAIQAEAQRIRQLHAIAAQRRAG
jgi:hypothetical protein